MARLLAWTDRAAINAAIDAEIVRREEARAMAEAEARWRGEEEARALDVDAAYREAQDNQWWSKWLRGTVR